MFTVKTIVIENKEVTHLQVSAGVRNWEDTEVNGIKDDYGLLIPCRSGNLWKPLIELKTGQIVNWDIGKTASINYRVVDDGTYILLNGDVKVAEIDGYVPQILSPEPDAEDDDYIVMTIDANGVIQNWTVILDEFNMDIDDFY